MSAKWQDQADYIFRLVDKIMMAIVNTSLVVIVLTICWSVWTRYVLRTPVVWADDVTSLTFAWFIFIGMAAVYFRRGHVSIDIVTTMMPPRLQLLFARLGDVIVGIFSAYTAYLCGRQTIISHLSARTPVLEIPLSWFFISLTIGFALMAIRAVGYLMNIGPIQLHDEI